MRKNCTIRIRLETEQLNKLKEEAEELDLSISELIRQKINPFSNLKNIISMLEDIHKKLIVKTKCQT